MLGREVEVLAIMAVVGWMHWCISYKGDRLENWIYSMGLPVWPLSTVPCLLISKACNIRVFWSLILQTVWHLKMQCIINWGVGVILLIVDTHWLTYTAHDYLPFFLAFTVFCSIYSTSWPWFFCVIHYIWGQLFSLLWAIKKSYSSIDWKNEDSQGIHQSGISTLQRPL